MSSYSEVMYALESLNAKDYNWTGPLKTRLEAAKGTESEPRVIREVMSVIHSHGFMTRVEKELIDSLLYS